MNFSVRLAQTMGVKHLPRGLTQPQCEESASSEAAAALAHSSLEPPDVAESVSLRLLFRGASKCIPSYNAC